MSGLVNISITSDGEAAKLVAEDIPGTTGHAELDVATTVEFFEKRHETLVVAVVFVQPINEHGEAVSLRHARDEPHETVLELIESPIWRIWRIRSSYVEVQMPPRGDDSAKLGSLTDKLMEKCPHKANLAFSRRGSRVPKVNATFKKPKFARPSLEALLNLLISADILHERAFPRGRFACNPKWDFARW